MGTEFRDRDAGGIHRHLPLRSTHRDNLAKLVRHIHVRISSQLFGRKDDKWREAKIRGRRVSLGGNRCRIAFRIPHNIGLLSREPDQFQPRVARACRRSLFHGWERQLRIRQVSWPDGTHRKEGVSYKINRVRLRHIRQRDNGDCGEMSVLYELVCGKNLLAFRIPVAGQERQHQEAGVPDLQIREHELFPSGSRLARRRNENNQHRYLDGLGFRIPAGEIFRGHRIGGPLTKRHCGRRGTDHGANQDQ